MRNILTLALLSACAGAFAFSYSTDFSEFSVGVFAGQDPTRWSTLVHNGGNEPNIVESGGNKFLRLSANAPGGVNRYSSVSLLFGQDLRLFPLVTISASVLAPDTNRHNLYFHQGLAQNGNFNPPWKPSQRLADNNFFRMLEDGANHDSKIVRDQFIEMRWVLNFGTNTVQTYYNNELLDNLPITTTNSLPTLEAFTYQMRTDFTGAGWGGEFWIDDVSVEAVPEPASLAALSLGALALLRRRRKAA